MLYIVILYHAPGKQGVERVKGRDVVFMKTLKREITKNSRSSYILAKFSKKQCKAKLLDKF